MKQIGIFFTVIVVLALIIWGIAQVNEPWALVVKATIKQIAKIEFVDQEEFQRINEELKTLKEDKRDLTRQQRTLVKENESYLKTIEKERETISSLRNSLNYLRARTFQLEIAQERLTPTQQVTQFDKLTTDDENSELIQKDNKVIVETTPERIADANLQMQEKRNLEIENAIQDQIISELEKNIEGYAKMNSNLETALDTQKQLTQIAVSEKNEYKELYDEVKGKTRKGLIVAYGIAAVEAIIIVTMLLNQ